MAMFAGAQTSPSGERGSRRGGEVGLTILANDMRLVGEFETRGVVKIEGCVEGTVRADTQVLIVKGGVVKGDVHTKEAVIGGAVHGNVFAEARVEIQDGSEIHGDVTTPRVAIHEGGQLNGRLHMGDRLTLAKASAPEVASTTRPERRRAGNVG